MLPLSHGAPLPPLQNPGENRLNTVRWGMTVRERLQLIAAEIVLFAETMDQIKKEKRFRVAISWSQSYEEILAKNLLYFPLITASFR